MKCKKIKILFGVPEGEYIARQFACIAAAMPEAKCRFVGFSWSTGCILRSQGLEYVHLPFKRKASMLPNAIPPLIEFVSRGYMGDTVPLSARQTFGTLSDFIECEVAGFAPDIVVYGPIDHALCYLLDQYAVSRGIPRLGIQTSFVANHFIVQTEGVFWEEYLRTAEIPKRLNAQILENELPSGYRDLRNCSNGKWKLRFWIRGFERALRVLTGGATFDTMHSLMASVVCKISPPQWFPNIETLELSENHYSGCVLVALHQPSLSWTSPSWIDLIRFALEATPDGVPIVIRPHPSEASRRIPKELDDALRTRGVLISRVSRGPELPLLLKHCRAVITLTSALGMEALLAGVPVFVLGPAFYARPGLAKKVSQLDVKAVRKMLVHPIQHQPDANEVTKFKHWLLSECMVIAPEYESGPVNGLIHRIRELLAINVDTEI